MEKKHTDMGEAREDKEELYLPVVQLITPFKNKKKKPCKTYAKKLELGKFYSKNIDKIYEEIQGELYQSMQEELVRKMLWYIGTKPEGPQICLVNILLELGASFNANRMLYPILEIEKIPEDNGKTPFLIAAVWIYDSDLWAVLDEVQKTVAEIKEVCEGESPNIFRFVLVIFDIFGGFLETCSLLRFISEEFFNMDRIAFFIFNIGNKAKHPFFKEEITTLDLKYPTAQRLNCTLLLKLFATYPHFPVLG